MRRRGAGSEHLPGVVVVGADFNVPVPSKESMLCTMPSSEPGKEADMYPYTRYTG